MQRVFKAVRAVRAQAERNPALAIPLDSVFKLLQEMEVPPKFILIRSPEACSIARQLLMGGWIYRGTISG